MKFFRSKLWILLLVLALTASIGACGYRPEPEKTESGQTVFRLGFSETPSSLDPYTAETDAAAAAISLLYDTLFYADIETGRYINSVCQEYTVQPAAADGARLWTLTLRNDVYFHDGTALTARDVEFSLQSMKDFSLLYGYPGCELIDTTGISVTDDTHLSFLAWGDVAAVEECLSRVPIVPKSVWNTRPGMEYTTSGIPKDASQAKKSLAALVLTPETMTGSGLYIWDKYENGVLTLRRSEDYWNGTARAEIVELHFGCDDLAAALENNAIDAAWNLSRAAAEELAEGRSTAYGTSGELLLVEFNQRTDDTSGGNALLLDKTVREAITLCADRETLALTGFGGAMPAYGFSVPYGTEGSAAAVCSAESAAALLESAGHTDADGDGVRESPEGESLSFRILCSDSSTAWVRAANLLKDMCAPAGIALEITVLSPDRALAAAEAGDFDLFLTASQSYYDAYLSLASFYWNDGNGAFWNGAVSPGWNISGYANSEFDALYEELTFASSAGRDALEQEMEDMVLTGCAGIKKPQTPEQQKRSACYQRLKGLYQSLGRVAPFKGLSDRLLSELRQKYGSPDYNALSEDMKKTFVKVVNEDLSPLLPRVQASTLLVWGENDTETPLWMGQQMEKEIPDAGLVIFENDDHFAYLRQWPRFVRVVQAFLK